MSKTKTFTVTQEHLALLDNMWVGWSDIEYGAPEIDPKRPYGNSSVVQDVYEICEWDAPLDHWGDPEFDGERAYAIHKEMQTVLQILISNRAIEPGTYESRQYGQRWRLLEQYVEARHKA